MTIQSIGAPGSLPFVQTTAPASTTTTTAKQTTKAADSNGTINASVSAEKTQQASGSPPPVKQSELDNAVKAIQDFIKNTNTSLDFHVDKDTDKLVVKVIDTSTHEVIKQIPSEDALALAKALDKLKGVLVSQQA